MYPNKRINVSRSLLNYRYLLILTQDSPRCVVCIGICLFMLLQQFRPDASAEPTHINVQFGDGSQHVSTVLTPRPVFTAPDDNATASSPKPTARSYYRCGCGGLSTSSAFPSDCHLIVGVRCWCVVMPIAVKFGILRCGAGSYPWWCMDVITCVELVG